MLRFAVHLSCNRFNTLTISQVLHRRLVSDYVQNVIADETKSYIEKALTPTFKM
jgi:hypothetical protein